MTTPANRNTAERVVVTALRNAKLLQPGDTPTPDQYVDNFQRLNDMALLWQTTGLKLWLDEDITVPLVAGQADYIFSPTGDVVMTKPMRVVQAYYSDVNGIRRPLIPLGLADWVRLSQINQSGQVNSYYVDKQATFMKVWFWLQPDTQAATGTAHLVWQVQMPTLTSLTDQMVFPQEWFMALAWGLAAEICIGQPDKIVTMCSMKAAETKSILEDWDVEDAPTIFAPDTRWQGGSAFR